MIVKEYLNKIKFFEGGKQITFVKARARKDANTPFYHAEYQTTPIFNKWELKEDMAIMNSIILNNKQSPIDWLSGVPWNNLVKRGELICLLVISMEDFALLYPSDDQRKNMEAFIDKSIKMNP